jgi:hypothetical protein
MRGCVTLKRENRWRRGSAPPLQRGSSIEIKKDDTDARRDNYRPHGGCDRRG